MALNEHRKTVFKWVTGTHLGILLLLLLVPWLKGCFQRKPKIIATFDLTAPPPPPPETVPEIPQPKPVPEPKKKIAPPSTNTPPKKVVKKIEPKKAEPKKPEPKKPAPKPKPAPKLTEAQRLAAIRQNKKVTNPNLSPAPSKPSLDFSGLQSALSSAASGSGSGSPGGTYSLFAWYYDRVKQQMYSVWQQPAGAPIGLTATATVRIGSDGTVYSKAITRRSGNLLFDQSVQNALNSTVRLPAPPADLPSRTIEIEFALSN